MVKPILFNTEMVRAILDGRKTVTRRIVKPQPMVGSTIYPNIDVAGKVCAEIWGNGAVKYIKQPYRRGDILWVRETWSQSKDGLFLYRAWTGEGQEPEKQDEAMRCLRLKWHPSIHMPREAARIFLQVTDVRVERLQESDESGARAEGAEPIMVQPADSDKWYEWGPARPRFIEIWGSTIKPADLEKYGWAANPWVWMITFERCEKPEEV